MEEVKEAHDKLLAEFNEYQAAVNKTIKYNARIAKETAKLDELETPENAPILKILRTLLLITDTLLEQETQFKTNCKRQMDELKTKIKALEEGGYIFFFGITSRKTEAKQSISFSSKIATMMKLKQLALPRSRPNTMPTRRSCKRSRSCSPRRRG